MSESELHHRHEDCGGRTVHDHGHDHHEHGLIELTIQLEDEHLPALDETAAELSAELKQHWDRGAVIRLALSEFFSRRGKIT